MSVAVSTDNGDVHFHDLVCLTESAGDREKILDFHQFEAEGSLFVRQFGRVQSVCFQHVCFLSRISADVFPQVWPLPVKEHLARRKVRRSCGFFNPLSGTAKAAAEVA
jgi:hypothetical protein